MCAIGGTTLFYISLACMAYAAFGNGVPGNVLSGFDNPFWLVDIANLAVIIHLIGAYQVIIVALNSLSQDTVLYFYYCIQFNMYIFFIFSGFCPTNFFRS